MIVKELPQEFLDAKPIIETIKQAGFEAYFVGGSVRDTLLGLPIHDVDIATSAYPREIKKIFKKTVDTGIQHGTVMVLDHGEGYEITTFRTESTYQDFRRPDHVTFVRSLEEDLKRRDLTINAFAMDETGRVIDMFDGLSDLQNKRLKAVGDAHERFHEDALRMMRTIRFASQLDFKIEEKTFQALEENAALLEKIAVERIHVEWIKLLMGKNPGCGLSAFYETKLYQHCPMFSKYGETFNELSKRKLEIQDEIEAWTLLSYCLKMDGKDSAKLLKAWKSSNETIAQTEKAVAALESIADRRVTRFTLYNAGETGLKTALAVAKQMEIAVDEDKLIHDYRTLPIKSKKDLKANGGDLIKEAGIKPGPKMGEILDYLEEEVLFGRVENEKTSLLELAKQRMK